MAEDFSPCRICGKTDQVSIYDDDHPEDTICMDCCSKATHKDGETGHRFDYERGEGWVCRYCGIPRNATDYDGD